MGETLTLWTIRTNEPRAVVRQSVKHAGGMVAMDVAGDGRCVVTAGRDGSVRVWPATTNGLEASFALPGTYATPQQIYISPDHRWMLLIHARRSTVLAEINLEARTATPRKVSGLRELANTAAFSRNGRWLAIGGTDNQAWLFDLAVPDLELTGFPWAKISGDIDPIAFRGGPGIARVTHFEQVYERARKATENVAGLFDQVTAFQNQVRHQQDTADALACEVQFKDIEYRNRLITIFGSPHAGNIGTGKPYPAGYNGPDLFFFMYDDVTEVSDATVPRPPANNNQCTNLWRGFQQQFTTNGGSGGVIQQAVQKYFLNDLTAAGFDGNTATPPVDTSILAMNMPITASSSKPSAFPGTESLTREIVKS